MKHFTIEKDFLSISGGWDIGFLRVDNKKSRTVCVLTPPVFELDGVLAGGDTLDFCGLSGEKELAGGGKEALLEYAFTQCKDLRLLVYLHTYPQSPFIRFRYSLNARNSVRLTKAEGKDRIDYAGFSMKTERPGLTEIQFSQFNPLVHSFNPNFEKKSADELSVGCEFPGPVILFEDREQCCLLAYEHGAEYPDTYLAFHAKSGLDSLEVELLAEKGNYYDRQVIDADHPFFSPWFHFAVCGNDLSELLMHYRTFLLMHICESRESRKPYIFYNTWNFQERNNYIHGKRYLDSMNSERILKEIDVAGRMGVDVFVIDTGWYGKTGDWLVSPERFPGGMSEIKQKLDGYGMKLGLWFNPTVAAKSSEIYGKHPEYRVTLDGEACSSEIWETEESFTMCLASGFSDYIIEKLVSLNRELGVSYFKWDGIGQYGCNSPLHHHGNETNTPEERQQCYSYQMGLEMIRIVEEVTRQCSNVIFDFDITEGGRFAGLGFLSAGKYFLVNNGPYAMDFDLPEKFDTASDRLAANLNPWTNVFFFPGPARSRFCRQGTKYDSFVPSILFLTHFLPDAPGLSQNNSLASIMLGSNGIWGDLPSLREQDIRLFHDTLVKYKKVGEAVVSSYPVVKGFIGSSPEIYEKIDHKKGQGIVCFFTKAKGNFTHITKGLNRCRTITVEGADSYEFLTDGRLKITVALDSDDARTVFVY